MQKAAEIIAGNVERVKEKIAAAAAKSGRTAESVTLVAVTKYVDAETTLLVAQAGCEVLGENRPQQLWAKAEQLQQAQQEVGFCWHLIGHLQRNKVGRTLPLVSLFHSVDSERLLREVDKAAGASEVTAETLLEVNISGDEAKHGWQPAEMPKILEAAAELENIRVIGLMAMAGLQTTSDTARREFAAVKQLAESLEPACGENSQMTALSMGMSRDFDVAIEEGATIVRVGSSLFDGVDRR